MCRTTRTAICHSRRRRICSGASRRRGASNCAVMVVSVCMYGVFCSSVGLSLAHVGVLTACSLCSLCRHDQALPEHPRTQDVLHVRQLAGAKSSTIAPRRAAPRRTAPHDACNERCKCVRHSGCGSRCAPILRWGAARTRVARALPCACCVHFCRPQCCATGRQRRT